MKRNLKWILIAATGLSAVAGIGGRVASVRADEPAVLQTPVDKASYGMGATMAKSFARQGVTIDVDALTRGLKDGMSGAKLLMTEDEMRETASAFQASAREHQMQTTRVAADARQKEGQAFLAQNARNEGVVTLPSGLQYKSLKPGDGPRPTDTDTVECNYRGTFINGTEFDSSAGRGQPVTFKLTQVIAGWKEALKLMPVGSKWQLFVPSELAYGQRGLAGPKGSEQRIGPNTTLVFEVELLAIHPTPADAEPTAAVAPAQSARRKQKR